MKTDYQYIIMCIIALVLGILVANMLKEVCSCKLVEGQTLDNGCFVEQEPSACQVNVMFIDGDNEPPGLIDALRGDSVGCLGSEPDGGWIRYQNDGQPLYMCRGGGMSIRVGEVESPLVWCNSNSENEDYNKCCDPLPQRLLTRPPPSPSPPPPSPSPPPSPPPPGDSLVYGVCECSPVISDDERFGMCRFTTPGENAPFCYMSKENVSQCLREAGISAEVIQQKLLVDYKATSKSNPLYTNQGAISGGKFFSNVWDQDQDDTVAWNDNYYYKIVDNSDPAGRVMLDMCENNNHEIVPCTGGIDTRAQLFGIRNDPNPNDYYIYQQQEDNSGLCTDY